MAYSAVWHTQVEDRPGQRSLDWQCHAGTPPPASSLLYRHAHFWERSRCSAKTRLTATSLWGWRTDTANRLPLSLARSFLNPGQIVQANVMAFKIPWTRENRIGLWGDNFQLRKDLLAVSTSEPVKSSFEFVLTPRSRVPTHPRTYPREAPIRTLRHSRITSQCSWAAEAASAVAARAPPRVNRSWQVIAEVNGCLVMHMPNANQSGDSLFYGGGARWTLLASHRFSPFAQFMFGRQKSHAGNRQSASYVSS